MRSDFVNEDFFRALLAAMTPPNRYALLVSATTGLRIDDVLSLKTEQIKKQRFTVTEKKTGKKRRVRLSDELLFKILSQSSEVWAFPGRLKPNLAHRTRQAVYKDLKRVADFFGVPDSIVLSPHSARKIYAVSEYRRTCDIKRVQELLNHSSEAVTMVYAMSDFLSEKKIKKLSKVSREKVSGKL